MTKILNLNYVICDTGSLFHNLVARDLAMNHGFQPERLNFKISTEPELGNTHLYSEYLETQELISLLPYLQFVRKVIAKASEEEHKSGIVQNILAIFSNYCSYIGRDRREETAMTLKLYAVAGGPPTYAVMMCLKALGLKYTHIAVDFEKGEHRTEEFAKKVNPQKEIPVLDDNGFYLGESNAILQYLCDKYSKDDQLYPKEPQSRALVNQRLCFDLSTYYRSMLEHFLALMSSDQTKITETRTKIQRSLSIYDTYLQQLGTKYAAADHVTIADFQFVTSTMSLEATNIDFSKYSLVSKWYETFKKENPDLWKVAEVGMNEISHFFKEH